MKHTAVALVVAFVLLACARPAPAAQEVTAEAVDEAIADIVQYIWKQQHESGAWHHHTNIQGMFPGGTTALAMFALLEAGESPQDPRMLKAADWLAKFKTNVTYVVATRVMALSQMVQHAKNSPYREAIEKDVDWLTRGVAQEGGAWGYHGAEREGDNSCSQFALLALWEAQRAGVDVRSTVIRAAEQAWVRRQRKDGGWTYTGEPTADTPSTTSMTTAGLASLYICQDVLSLTAGDYRYDKNMDAGWELLAENLPSNYIRNGYLAFCVQRVGMASGQKFIGDLDWFEVGARPLTRRSPLGRSYRGQWGGLVRACFELIFLSRGRTPLTFNKLDYGDASNWNFYPRDVPRFTEFMRRNFELRMRWQVVKVSDDVDRMLDARILLVSGARPMELSDQQWDKLREYTLRGGTMLLMPARTSTVFVESVKEQLATLYTEQREQNGEHYELKKLPADHPIYNLYQDIPDPLDYAPMYGVSDGTRLLAILCERDIAAAWQRNMPVRGRMDFLLGANFYFYATGRNPMRMRMRPVFAGTGTQKKHTLKVGWIKHGGQWHTQPYALNYLSEKLIAENWVTLETNAGIPLAGDKLAGHHILWMTGCEPFEMDDAEIDALRDYLLEGGTLFINAVGGSQAFSSSAEAMLDKLFPPGKRFLGEQVASGYVSQYSPLMSGRFGDEFIGPELETAELRRTYAWKSVARDPAPPLRVYAQYGRALVIYGQYGIHDTLDGHTAYGAKSYLPNSAMNVAANVALYGLMEKPKPPAPATAPATTGAATAPTSEKADQAEEGAPADESADEANDAETDADKPAPTDRSLRPTVR